jgi:hypothetical protein
VSCGLRDVLSFEEAGKPAVLVASAAFVQAADDQAEKLGLPALKREFVPHPVQDRTDDEMRAMAGEVIDSVVAALRG